MTNKILNLLISVQLTLTKIIFTEYMALLILSLFLQPIMWYNLDDVNWFDAIVIVDFTFDTILQYLYYLDGNQAYYYHNSAF
jgi:hypothetical protein